MVWLAQFNKALGADIATFQDLIARLSLYSPAEAARLDQYARQVSLKIAFKLDAELGPLGEIGLDLGYDEQHKLWFFEGNAKPDKDPLPGEDYGEEVPLPFLNTVKYARYLAGFSL